MAPSRRQSPLGSAAQSLGVAAVMATGVVLWLPPQAGAQAPAAASAPASAPAAAPWGAGPGSGRVPGPMGMARADQRFIVMMIPHHDGAIAMADLALSRARHPQLKALAERISSSQRRENALMRSWYRQWYGADVGSTPVDQADGLPWGMGMGMGMGHGAMGTRATADSLAVLNSAPDFDRAFIEQMVPHHWMGVMMASMGQMHSQHPQLRQLQAAMVRVQSEEIQQMQQWYRQWYGAGAGR
ncbi:MAG: DUF305 domain-containing protein [Cyanobium sp.]